MIYGNIALEKLIKEERIKPSDGLKINPASVNLCLGNTFLIPKPDQIITLGQKVEYTEIYTEDGGGFIIQPGQFVLATTKEWISVPENGAAFVQGRSSIGRSGLTVQNAGFVDPGFHGHITLELRNDMPCPIILIPGYPVTQLVYMDVKDIDKVYEGKYNNQVKATGSRMYMDEFNTKEKTE